MLISFAPQRRDDTLTLVKVGDVLTINGEDFNFSGLTDGASLPSDAVDCDWIVGDVARIDGTSEAGGTADRTSRSCGR